MTQNGHDQALDVSIDVPGDDSATSAPATDAHPEAKDESIVDKLLKVGSDAPDAADIEDPDHQI